MANFKQLLIPLDGSKMGEIVFPFSRELAYRLGMEITCLHICELGDDQFCPMHEAYVKTAADKLMEQGKESGQPVKAKSAIFEGQPSEGIVRYAEQAKSDFILMATHGRSGFNRWVLGSNAIKVLRHTSIPVWLIRNGSSVNCNWPKTEIIVPLDESPLAESILPFVIKLVKDWGLENTQVILTRVCDEPIIPSDFTDEMQDVWREKKNQEAAVCSISGQRYLKSIQSSLKDEGIDSRIEVRVGKVAEEIISLASASPFSFIIMSTHGHSGRGRWMYGSTTERVIVGATCPILLVKPDQNH